MKKYLSIVFLLAALVSGCSNKEELETSVKPSGNRIFTATFEQNESRTYLEGGQYLRWNAGDLLTIFDGCTLNRQFMFNGETGANSGSFSEVTTNSGSDYTTGNTLNANYAVYPYDSEMPITESGVITVSLPAEQSYAENSFGQGDNTMVAVTQNTDDTFLKFKNVGGYLELYLYGEDVTIKSITLQGNNQEKLAGTATLTPTYGGEPTVSIASDATETITLECGEGVTIGTSAEEATAFLMVVPPTTFESGFTITVTDTNGGEFTKSTSKSIAIERNVILSMTAFEVEFETEVDDTPYLTFSAEDKQSLTMSKAVATLEYSVGDSDEWYELGTNTVDFGGELGDLRLRGKSLRGTAINPGYSGSKFIFENSTLVSCSGNILTLVDYEKYSTVDTSNAAFRALFNGCTCLISAPELPATNLEEYCYYDMFSGCINLKEAPKLPATNMSYACYLSMFSSCTSLISAPELPATNLEEFCYYRMFSNCTSLISAPELPATNLEESCYEWMFGSCTSLSKAPKLSAVNLAVNCCANMFDGCTGLIEAPELLAASLKEYCYGSMFKGCTSLVKAPKLPATTLAKSCYSEMFNGCTNLTEAPELSETNLRYYCYLGMFRGCTSLVQAPILPATLLVDYCYYEMFSGCKQLNEITMLGVNISASHCLNGWLNNVSSTGTFIKASNMESLSTGINGIPSGWTVKNYGEE